MLTLHSIFCGSFSWLSYLVLFFVTLLVSIGFQYLFNSYLEAHIQQASLNSSLLVLIVLTLIVCLFSVVLGVTLSWVRFGAASVEDLGAIDTC